jgi:hypothetical protein
MYKHYPRKKKGKSMLPIRSLEVTDIPQEPTHVHDKDAKTTSIQILKNNKKKTKKIVKPCKQLCSYMYNS